MSQLTTNLFVLHNSGTGLHYHADFFVEMMLVVNWPGKYLCGNN